MEEHPVMMFFVIFQSLFLSVALQKRDKTILWFIKIIKTYLGSFKIVS